MKRPNRLVILFGPTGVGKTSLTESFAGCGAEIISADALQVYRGLDIGTAKPSRACRARFVHHLIDICDPDEPYDVGRFVQDAETAASITWNRQLLPIMSGGTAYYIKHFLMGLPEAPKSDPEIRVKTAGLLREHGLEWCRRRLEAVDPLTAAAVGKHDSVRILRALEVFETAGRPLSSFGSCGRLRNDLELLIIGLYRERDELDRRIDARVDLMFSQGLAAEAAGLFRRGALRTWPGMKGIGYREFFDWQNSGESTIQEVKEQIKQHSRAYARRQMTFFRTIPETRWHHPDRDRETVIGLIGRLLS